MGVDVDQTGKKREARQIRGFAIGSCGRNDVDDTVALDDDGLFFAHDTVVRIEDAIGQ